jgi:hypothetical protein
VCVLLQTRADDAARPGPSHIKEPADSARKVNSDPSRYIRAQIAQICTMWTAAGASGTSGGSRYSRCQAASMCEDRSGAPHWVAKSSRCGM